MGRTTPWAAAATALGTLVGLLACSSDGTPGAGAGGGGGAAGAGAGGGGALAGADAGPDAEAGLLDLGLPDFVAGAALVNPDVYGEVRVRVVPSRPVAALSAVLDGAPLGVTEEGGEHRVRVPTLGLSAGDHALEVSAEGVTVSATLRVAPGSVEHTRFEEVGPASHVRLLADGERWHLVWNDARDGERHVWRLPVDGAGRPLSGPLRVDPDGAPTARLDAALAQDGTMGVLLQGPGDFGGAPGARLVLLATAPGATTPPAPIELNGENPGLLGTESALAWDGAAFVAVWAELALPAVEKRLRYARITPDGTLEGPHTLLTEREAANGDGRIPDLQRLALACSGRRCVVAYQADVYVPLVDLAVPQLWLTGVTRGGVVTPPVAVMPGDWDLQEGPSLVALEGGDFALAFVATDTRRAVFPEDPCDESGRQRVLLARLDAEGALRARPAVLHDPPGQRFQATVAPHPQGLALLWEDQREKCASLLTGQNRLAANFVLGGALEAPYTPWPSSRLILRSSMSTLPAGHGFGFAWIDERKGGSVLEPRGQVMLDRYWR